MATFVSPVTEPTNADLREDFARLEKKVDEFLADHRRDHGVLESRLALHDTAAAIRDQKLASLSQLEPTVRNLHDFEVQVRMVATSVRWITGGSIIAAIAGLLSLALTLAHLLAGKPV